MKKHRIFALLTTVCMAASMAACGGASSTAASTSAGSTAAGGKSPVTITVVSSFGGEDGNRQNFVNYIGKYEEATGNKVKETGATADETWKAQVQTDFQAGSEPDVLFFFNGADSNPIVESGKVVPIDEIREVYPEYATNMKDSLLGASPLDGVNYSVPFIGYWEALYCNTAVLDACGVKVPTDSTYTWEQFLADCKTIKDAGYTPIAMSLQQLPHYWFEYCVLNHENPADHLNIPVTEGDATSKIWAAGIDDIKTLYENGCFPANTLTATDDETMQLIATDEAAFAIDGSWKYGWMKDNDCLDKVITICPPAQGERKATDMIGGISMGYYITRQAWEDETKRDACVQFVEMMTSDEATSSFAEAGNVTALKNAVTPAANTDPLLDSIYKMNATCTSVIGATQDGLLGEERDNLFSNVKNVATGAMTADDAVTEMINKVS